MDLMMSTQVGARAAVRVPYTLPRRVQVRVFATGMVDVYLVDSEQLATWRERGGDVRSWAASKDRREHVVNAVLPRRPQWHLLIVNRAAQQVSADYDVVIL